MVDYWNLKGGLRIFWNSSSGWMPIDFPLWFLRDLIIITLLTPIIYYFTKKTGIIGVILLGIVHISGVHVPEGLSWGTPFYFSLGCYLQIKHKDLLESINGLKFISIILTIVLLITITWAWGRYPINSYLHATLMIIGPICMIGYSEGLTHGKLMIIAEKYSSAAFFIFAFHGIITSYVSIALDIALPSELVAVQLAGYFLRTIINIMICIGVFIVMRKYMPCVLNVISGNR